MNAAFTLPSDSAPRCQQGARMLRSSALPRQQVSYHDWARLHLPRLFALLEEPVSDICRFRGCCQSSLTRLRWTHESLNRAAANRPCARCRRAAFLAFATAWARAAGLAALPTAPEIDAALALERGTRLLVDPADLPDGAIVSVQDGKSCWLIDDGCKYRWSVGGYGPLEALPRTAMVALTSPSIIAVLRAGYMSLRLQPPSNVTATSPTSGRSVDR